MNGAPLEVDTRKAIALLAYLTVEQTSTRDSLATLFWRDSSSERARATLRRTLSSLRTAVGAEALDAGRLRISLRGIVRSDVADFAASLEATKGHDHQPSDVCPDCVPHLERATGLYRGDFLKGFSVRDAPEFEDWVRTTAEAFRLRAGDAINRLATAQAAGGDFPAAIASVGRWIELDPLHEPAHRQLMLLHAWAGDRPGAVEAHRRCVAILGQELGVAPLEETTELYEAILDEDLPPAPGIRRRVTVTDLAGRPITPSDFIDRSDQLKALDREFGLCSTGGRVVIVTGDAWMGKTRLLDEFIATNLAKGTRSARARGFRAERSLPFGVVVQLLRGMQGLPDRTPPWAIREVCRLAPELAPEGHEPAPPPEAHGETRLFDALVSVLASPLDPPSIIAVDDLQWCDPASASFLSYLANRMDQSSHLLVLSARSNEPDSPPSLAELTRPGGSWSDIELRPLSAEELSGLITEPAEAETVITKTGGIPLLVSEYVAAGNGDISAGVRAFVDSHLAELGDLQRQVLAAAAVLDGICDLDLLRSTSGRSEEEIVEAVEQLVFRDLLRMSTSGDAVFFALESVERLVYETTSVVRRRLLHARAAASLRERTTASTDARIATTVARHLQASGSNMEAADWYARAGDLAYEVYAHAEAESSYRLAQALGHSDPARVRLPLARLYLLTGRYREAMVEYETVAATSPGAQAALAEHGIGEVHRRLGRFELAVHHFEQAEPDHPESGQLYADWALLAHRSGDVEQGGLMAQRSLAEAEAREDRSLTARAHHLLGIVTPDPSQARPHFERALALAPNDPMQRMASLNGLAHEVGRNGEYSEAISLVKEALDLARKVGDRHRQAALVNHLADLHYQTGDQEQAEKLITESVKLFAAIEPDAWEPEIWLLTGW